MIYDVRHRTTFGYEDRVSVSQHVLHLMPRNTSSQTRSKFDLTVIPDPNSMAVSNDYFGNVIHHLSVQEPHSELVIEAQSRVDVIARNVDNADLGPPWEEIVASVSASPSVAQFIYDSPYALRDAAVRNFALETFIAGRPIAAAAMDLTTRIYTGFKYEGGVSDVSTPVKQVLEMRKGVCQDFAHLELACIRSLGLPARYVSGYLMTHPPAGKEKLIGADASHAWIAVWCGPSLGWIDFDPTNGLIPSIEHVTVAWGRDYGDVSPINGFILGGGSHEVRVAVDVTPVAVAA